MKLSKDSFNDADALYKYKLHAAMVLQNPTN